MTTSTTQRQFMNNELLNHDHKEEETSQPDSSFNDSKSKARLDHNNNEESHSSTPVKLVVNINKLIYADPLYRPHFYSAYYNPFDPSINFSLTEKKSSAIMPGRSSSSFNVNSERKSGYSYFPIFDPIHERRSLSHSLSRTGIDVDDDHVIVVEPETLDRRANYPYDDEKEDGGDVFRSDTKIDRYGPRFSRITITSRNNSILPVNPTSARATMVQVLPTTIPVNNAKSVQLDRHHKDIPSISICPSQKQTQHECKSSHHHQQMVNETVTPVKHVDDTPPPSLPSTPVPQMRSSKMSPEIHRRQNEKVVMKEKDVNLNHRERSPSSQSSKTSSFDLSSPSPSSPTHEKNDKRTNGLLSKSPDDLMISWSSSSSNSNMNKINCPSSVTDEMIAGHGFKSWARKNSPPATTGRIELRSGSCQKDCCLNRENNQDDHINSHRSSSTPRQVMTYSSPIWSQKELRNLSPINPILKEPVNVQVISHARRYSIHNQKECNNNCSRNYNSFTRTHHSLHPAIVAGGAVGYGAYGSILRQRRRSSVLQTVFGSGGNRRFSEDLRSKDHIFPIDEDSETSKVIFFQVFIPFLIAGFGNVGAGLILDYVQHWPVFRATPELFILVASFLGFKGNLEMTLAARLATQANCGELDSPKAQLSIGIGNVALIQAQATVVAFLAALIAIAINYFKEFVFNPHSCLLILTTSLVTAAITGLFLSLLMVIVTILARKVGVNPDNVSTLLAAFLGDISAVILLAGSAKLFYDYRHIYWLDYTVIAFFLLILPIFLIVARKNPYTHEVVGTGWFPIIIAMVISSIGGLIFDFAVETFQTIAVFQPIINGVGANLVAVQASRISTYLHQRVELGQLPVDDDDDDSRRNPSGKYKLCQTPFAAFFGKNPNVKTARLLLLMSIPGHMIYIVTIRLIQPGQVFITFPFIAFYLTVAIVQVLILLYMAHLIVPFLWSKKIDPDNAAIPGIMSCGDLLGTAFLTIAYFVLVKLDDPNTHNYFEHVDDVLPVL